MCADYAEKILVDVLALSKKLAEQQPGRVPLQGKLAYAGPDNFLGRIVNGYHAEAQEVILFDKQAAVALCQVQWALNERQLGLFIFDAYRPLRAVRDFGQWFRSPPSSEFELQRKQIHYPHLEKMDLEPLGYVAGVESRHNFGHAIDLTLLDLQSGKFLDMGACFDYFGEISHLTASEQQIGRIAYHNRQLLVDYMEQYGFISYIKEYWHFDYQQKQAKLPLDIEILSSYKGWNVEQISV